MWWLNFTLLFVVVFAVVVASTPEERVGLAAQEDAFLIPGATNSNVTENAEELTILNRQRRAPKYKWIVGLLKRGIYSRTLRKVMGGTGRAVENYGRKLAKKTSNVVSKSMQKIKQTVLKKVPLKGVGKGSRSASHMKKSLNTGASQTVSRGKSNAPSKSLSRADKASMAARKKGGKPGKPRQKKKVKEEPIKSEKTPPKNKETPKGKTKKEEPKKGKLTPQPVDWRDIMNIRKKKTGSKPARKPRAPKRPDGPLRIKKDPTHITPGKLPRRVPLPTYRAPPPRPPPGIGR